MGTLLVNKMLQTCVVALGVATDEKGSIPKGSEPLKGSIVLLSAVPKIRITMIHGTCTKRTNDDTTRIVTSIIRTL